MYKYEINKAKVVFRIFLLTLCIISILVLYHPVLFASESSQLIKSTESQNLTQNDIESYQNLYQDTSISICIEGQLFTYCLEPDGSYSLYNFGSIDNYNFWLDNGIYIIKWDGNILEDQQSIKSVIDLQTYEVLY